MTKSAIADLVIFIVEILNGNLHFLCSDDFLEAKVIKIFEYVGIKININKIEACHRIGKSTSDSKAMIVRVANRKIYKYLYKNVSLYNQNLEFLLVNLTISSQIL